MRRSWLTRLWLWLPPLVFMAAIFHLSSESDPMPQLTMHVWDKVLHTTEYAILGLLVCRALRGEGFRWLPAILAAAIVTSAYGASDEWHQSFVPMRDSDIHDWYADTTGGLLGTALYTAGRRRQYGFTSAASTSTDTA